MRQEKSNQTAVLYNAECPVCRFEIDHYAAYSSDNTLGIAFDDLNDTAKLDTWGIDPDTAARRLHVLKNGELLRGIPAFIALWQDMPKYHWLARLVSRPGIYQVACFGYDFILAPLIYRWHLRRQRRAAAL